MTRWNKWGKPALGLVALLIAVQAGVSLLVRTHRMHAYLTAHLQRAFGRPAQVGSFSVRILPMPRLDADEVTIAEDPAFGNEYFLRADHLSAALRWSGLLRGQFEFGTLSLTRPSLILVRNRAGRWNLERWLPPAQAAPGANKRVYGPAAEVAPVNHLRRIEFDEGRINFKSEEEKLPFAFTGVSGSVDQVSPGRWQLQLEAQPWRSGVALQSTGTLMVRGDVAGTSARLQPAQISVHWEDVSLADLFRLLWGQDYGVRGVFAVDAVAKSAAFPNPPANSAADPPGDGAPAEPGDWTFSLQARATQIHRWDLTERNDNPRLSVSVAGRWNIADGSLNADELALTAPLSNVHGTANFVSGPVRGFELRLDSAGIQAADLLAWYRAFHPGVADGISADQYFTGGLTLRAWPLELTDLAFSSAGGRVVVPGLAGPLRIGPVRGGRRRTKLELEPVRISFAGGRRGESPAAKSAAAISKLRGSAAAASALEVGFTHDFATHAGGVSINGHLDKLEDALKVAAEFGHTLNYGWELSGGATAALNWNWTDAPLRGRWNGQLEFSKAQLQAAGLNQPLQLADAKLVWTEGKRTAVIAKAEGFGATWSGEIVQPDSVPQQADARWKVHLHADHLDAAELDRWVGPRARPSWLQRLLSSLLGRAAPAAAASALVRRIGAEGDLQIDELTIEKLKLEQVHAEGSLHNLELDVPRAEARWSGGAVQAKLFATFSPRPQYEVTAKLDRLNLAQLPGPASVINRLTGLASGSLYLTTAGVGRDELLQKLTGTGDLRFSNVAFRGWDVIATVADGAPRTGTSRWTFGVGVFTLRNRNVQLDQLRLDSGRLQTSVRGVVSFARDADVSIQTAEAGRRENRATVGHVLKISGPLDGPRVSVEKISVREPAD